MYAVSYNRQSLINNIERSFTMHIHTRYSHPSASDYLDTDSCLAIDLLTVVHRLLTHSFQIANDNGFQFCGYPLSRLRTNGHITSCLVETDFDVTPAMDINVQLVNHLLSIMTDCCPERLFRHFCCDVPDDLFL